MQRKEQGGGEFLQGPASRSFLSPLFSPLHPLHPVEGGEGVRHYGVKVQISYANPSTRPTTVRNGGSYDTTFLMAAVLTAGLSFPSTFLSVWAQSVFLLVVKTSAYLFRLVCKSISAVHYLTTHHTAFPCSPAFIFFFCTFWFC